MARSVQERLAFRSRRDADGCLLWLGSRDNRTGYGVIIRDARPVKVHRAAWEVAFGPIPTGLLVCHRCDVRACIEPTHLWLGSQADNMRDAAAKGRIRSAAGWNKGVPHSEATKAKIAAKRRERPGLPRSPETRAKMSAARSAWWARRTS